MLHINLLPWRITNYERNKRKNIFFLVIVSAIAVLILVGWYFSIAEKHALQVRKTDLLKEKISALSQDIAKYKKAEENYNNLVKTINSFNSLQVNRFQIVSLFNLLPRITPEKINLTSLEFDRDNIVITGVARSNEDIVTMMNNIEKVKWLKKVNLEKFDRGKKERGIIFFNLEMQVNFAEKKQEST